MLEQSFGLFFYLKQTKNQKPDGSKYVYLRITVDGISKELSTKKLWLPTRWNSGLGRASGPKEDAKTLNFHLDSLVITVDKAKTYLLNRGKEISASSIKDVLLGNSDDNKTILFLFEEHNTRLNTLIPTGEYTHSTYMKYRTALEHTRAFIKHKYGKSDLAINELNYGFIVDFSYWLKSVKQCGPNATAKYISNLKKIVLDCVKRGWLQRDPFFGFKAIKKEVVKYPLDGDELQRIFEKTFDAERLELVKDIFLFSCFTGLAYIDVKQLKRQQIQKGFDDQLWLNFQRQKTDSPTRLPINIF